MALRMSTRVGVARSADAMEQAIMEQAIASSPAVTIGAADLTVIWK
jgi:hypothetical protein